MIDGTANIVQTKKFIKAGGGRNKKSENSKEKKSSRHGKKERLVSFQAKSIFKLFF